MNSEDTKRENYLKVDESFASAFKYALEQGFINFDMTNFKGWQDNCDCASCRSQRIIVDYLWSVEPVTAPAL